MALEITVYPFLGVAEQNFAKNPLQDPHTPSPRMEEMRINEGIRDAQEYHGQNLDEYPHRGPIALSPLEMNLLGRVTRARGLPFNPEKRVYHYLELLPRLEARSQAIRRGFWQITENPASEGTERPRDEIRREMRERQAKWLRPSLAKKPSGGKPPGKPKK